MPEQKTAPQPKAAVTILATGIRTLIPLNRKLAVAENAAPRYSPKAIASRLSQLRRQPKMDRNANQGRPRCSRADCTPMKPTSVAATLVASTEPADHTSKTIAVAKTNQIPTLACVRTSITTNGSCPGCTSSDTLSRDTSSAASCGFDSRLETNCVVGCVTRLRGRYSVSDGSHSRWQREPIRHQRSLS